MMNDYPIVDHRARLERIRLEAVERRERALLDQCAPDSTPAMRVQVWEKLHQLSLPRDPAHAILQQVADQTALELAEVLEVQRQRKAARKS